MMDVMFKLLLPLAILCLYVMVLFLEKRIDKLEQKQDDKEKA